MSGDLPVSTLSCSVTSSIIIMENRSGGVVIEFKQANGFQRAMKES